MLLLPVVAWLGGRLRTSSELLPRGSATDMTAEQAA